MPTYLSLTDLFLVGLAFDICGAILLAKGLLSSPRALSKLNTFWGVGYGQHQDRCENRVDGEFGVSYLVLGFFFQAIGYSLDIAGVQNENGTRRLIAALLMASVAVALTWIAWRFLRGPRLHTLQAAIEQEGQAAKAGNRRGGRCEEKVRPSGTPRLRGSRTSDGSVDIPSRHRTGASEPLGYRLVYALRNLEKQGRSVLLRGKRGQWSGDGHL